MLGSMKTHHAKLSLDKTLRIPIVLDDMKFLDVEEFELSFRTHTITKEKFIEVQCSAITSHQLRDFVRGSAKEAAFSPAHISAGN